MSAPVIDPDAPVAVVEPHYRALRAVAWATATGAFAGMLWPVELTVSLALYGRDTSTEAFLSGDVHFVPLVLAGGFCGLVTGSLVGWLSGNDRLRAALLLGAIGSACGAAGGGLTVPVMRAGAPLLHPLLSSALWWALIGAFAGLTGSLSVSEGDTPPERSRPSPVLAALGWGLGCAVCSGGSWGGAWLVLCAWLDIAFPLRGPVSETVVSALPLSALGAAYGCSTGAIVGLFRWRDRSSAFFLALAGALVGAFGYGLSALTVAATDEVMHPLLSSSLTMATVGFVVGLWGYRVSRPTTKPAADDLAYEEEEPAAPGAKIEWLLHEPKRPWRLPRPLVRVLPVLAVAIGALVGAAFAPSLALLAVSLLGLAVAWVLYRQEQRLDALERRGRAARDS